MIDNNPKLGDARLSYWRTHPVEFIEQNLFNPETKKPYKLQPSQKLFIEHALKTNASNKLVYSDWIYSTIKKTGKTAFAAMLELTVIMLYGSDFAEGYIAANDQQQASERVFEVCKRIIAASPLLKREARVTGERIVFPATNSFITALASDYASAAGGHPCLAVFDELWGFTTERARKFWDELVPVPTRKFSARLIVSHAGFSGESELLEELYRQGLKLPQIGPDLYAGNGLLMFWSHEPLAEWQDEAWFASMKRTMRPAQYLRMCENRWVTSEQTFITLSAWDRIVSPSCAPIAADPLLPIFVGVDASHKYDQTAIVAVTFDKKAQQTRQVFHRSFQPSPDHPLDFESTIERTIMELSKRFRIRKVLFDPWQMQSVSQRLARAGIPIEELPQSPANLTMISQNLYELINDQRLVTYPAPDIRLAISRAVAVETARGWRITKTTASHKIDLVVALAMAAYAAQISAAEHGYDSSFAGFQEDTVSGPPHARSPSGSDLLGYISALRFGGVI